MPVGLEIKPRRVLRRDGVFSIISQQEFYVLNVEMIHLR
jgi:hypothetical protein